MKMGINNIALYETRIKIRDRRCYIREEYGSLEVWSVSLEEPIGDVSSRDEFEAVAKAAGWSPMKWEPKDDVKPVEPTIRDFFSVASPITLASLAADCDEALDSDGGVPGRTLRDMAMKNLVAIVGEAEAEAMVRGALANV